MALSSPVYGAGRGIVARTLLRLPLPTSWVESIFPVACLACGQGIEGREPRALGLCLPCRGRLRAAPPLEETPEALDALRARFRYEPPLDSVVRALKFRRLDYLGRHLGVEMAASFGVELAAVDAVVAVPLHWRRRFTRGFDQAEAIARALANAANLPYVAALRRRRSTRPQTFRGKAARRVNLEGAFTTRSRVGLDGLSLALIDDVTTTGSTLSAAASALRAAGAREVIGLVAAWTP